MANFKNGTNNEFIDISSEEYRIYIFQVPNSPFTTQVRINEPLKLNVSNNGHRIFDYKGASHYIPKGWIHLKWKAKENQPNFIK